MNILWCLLLGHTVFFHVTCDARPSYYIATPGTPVLGTNTSLAVHWFGDNYTEINVTAAIMDNNTLLAKASKAFYKDSIGILTLPAFTDSSSISYTLVVNGSAQNTLVFSDNLQLYIQNSSISLFIQTDKTVYKPGESVRIRIISISHDMKPYKGEVDLMIRDPKLNIVQEKLKMKSNLGVMSTHFLLSNNPMPGVWNIQVSSYNSLNSVVFSVDEYATSTFDIILEVPPVYISPKRYNLTGSVTAKYPYGKPLKGNVTIYVKSPYEGDLFIAVNKTFEVSGTANFSFTYDEIMNILYWGYMNVTASVTEEFTGIVANASSYVRNENSEYSLSQIGQLQSFTPGLNLTAKVRVQRIDNKTLTTEERNKKVTVKIAQSTGPYWMSWEPISSSTTLDNNFILQYYSIPQSGIITLEFPVLQSVQVIQVEVEYENSTQTLYFDKPYGTTPFIQMETTNSPFKVGVPFTVQVNTFPKVLDIYYVVMAKENVVSAGKNRTTFSLTPEQSWAPTAKVIVYFLNVNGSFGDIIQTSEIIYIMGTLRNKVNLSWSKITSRPSENVSLSVTVKELPCLVCLRVVEKSSMLLGDGNDIVTSKVEEELNLYYQGTQASLSNAIIYNAFGTNLGIKEEWFPPKQVNLIFPETWIWLETNISSSLTSLQFAVPDKNTSWVATAFVISEELGLGITDEPVEISVVKPLFITFNMPFSLTRGEQFILEVIVSNSLKENTQVMVTLESSNAFEIMAPVAGTVAGQQNVTVPSEGTTSVLFPIKPKILGNFTVTVKATSKAASDVLTKAILVRAEGMRYFYSQAVLFQIETNGNENMTASKNFSFSFPSDVVPGSQEAFITVNGDLLAPSISGLQALILMPYGCGEQNMINFAPNIYILKYLIVTKQIKPDIQQTAISFMEQGYQRELNYMRYDGSFSAFGNSDASGSTWLTSFVLRCFLQARPFIYINSDVLNGTIEWLVQFQDMNTGVFSEPGRVIHKELQGGLNGPITLTAYILTSLLEDKYYRNLYESRVAKAVQYLEGKFDEGISSNYTMSVVVYALSLANSTKAVTALTQLNSRASIIGGTKYWSAPSETTSYIWQPRTTNIETAAYALMSFSQQNRIAEGFPVMKWLSEQRNHLGGYSSTQDTVMALQALSRFASVVPSSDPSLTVTVSGPFAPKIFHITSKLLVLQSQQIEIAQPLLIDVTAVGKGLAIVQLNVAYNRILPPRRRRSALSEAFKLDVTVKEKTINIQKLAVDVCMSYLGQDKESGMVILDFGFLSGFKLSPEGIPTKEPLKLVEPKDDKIYLYFDSLTNNEVCVSIPMVRFANVAGSQDAVVTVYEYYNPRNTATRTYNSLTMRKISYCDFCGFNCKQCKSNVPEKPQTSSAITSTFSMLGLCMILVCYLL